VEDMHVEKEKRRKISTKVKKKKKRVLRCNMFMLQRFCFVVVLMLGIMFSVANKILKNNCQYFEKSNRSFYIICRILDVTFSHASTASYLFG